MAMFGLKHRTNAEFLVFNAARTSVSTTPNIEQATLFDKVSEMADAIEQHRVNSGSSALVGSIVEVGAAVTQELND